MRKFISILSLGTLLAIPSIFCLSLFFLVLSPIALAQDVNFYDIGAYPGGTWSSARDINNYGVVVGSGGTANANKHALGYSLFGPNAGKWTDFGTLGTNVDFWSENEATSVADNGSVVGYSTRDDGYVHGFVWTAKSGMTDLGVLSALGHVYSQAIGINRDGFLIVGWSSSSYDWSEFGWSFWAPAVAVVWTPQIAWENGHFTFKWKMQPLDQTGFEDFPYFYASSVNNKGQIVGGAYDNTGRRIALLWNPLPGGTGWKVQQLSTPPDFPISWAVDISDMGQVAGWAYTGGWSYSTAAIWQPAGFFNRTWKFVQLASLTNPPLWGGQGANGINNRGDIVGTSNDALGNWQATRWSAFNPARIKLLGIPGTPAVGVRINDFSVAAGTYHSSTCGWCMVAVKLRTGSEDTQ